MDNQLILKRVEDIATPVLEGLGYELVEREFLMDQGRWVLRLYIDRDGGVTVDDCTRASHSLETLIDVEDVIPVSYTLEVSSPGVNRPLRRKKDFEKFCGSLVRLKTLHPIDGRSNYKGMLMAVDEDAIVMSVDGAEYRIPYAELLRARIESDDVQMSKKVIN